jgi:hypothetical protein
MAQMQHRFVTTNGIKMHYVEQGPGPLVVLAMDGRSPGTRGVTRFPRWRRPVFG